MEAIDELRHLHNLLRGIFLCINWKFQELVKVTRNLTTWSNIYGQSDKKLQKILIVPKWKTYSKNVLRTHWAKLVVNLWEYWWNR